MEKKSVLKWLNVEMWFFTSGLKFINKKTLKKNRFNFEPVYISTILKFKFFLNILYLIFKMPVCIQQVVYCFAGMQHCGMVFTSDL